MPVRTIGGGGGGGGSAGPTFIVTDNVAVKDEPTFSWVFADSFAVSDATLGWGMTPTDRMGLADSLLVLDAVAAVNDRYGLRDSVLFTASGVTMLAQKDTWADVVAACPVDTARDGSDLQSDGVVATRKDMLCGWDVSGFPVGASVSTATLTMGLKTPPVTSATASWSTIAAANEGWVESTTRCSTIPAEVASGSDSVGPGTGAGPRDVVWTLNTTGRAALEARMGVGYFSMRFRGGTGQTNCVYESADEGTNNALGPRLNVTFTKQI